VENCFIRVQVIIAVIIGPCFFYRLEYTIGSGAISRSLYSNSSFFLPPFPSCFFFRSTVHTHISYTTMTVFSNFSDAIRGQPSSHKVKKGRMALSWNCFQCQQGLMMMMIGVHGMKNTSSGASTWKAVVLTHLLYMLMLLVDSHSDRHTDILGTGGYSRECR